MGNCNSQNVVQPVYDITQLVINSFKTQYSEELVKTLIDNEFIHLNIHTLRLFILSYVYEYGNIYLNYKIRKYESALINYHISRIILVLMDDKRIDKSILTVFDYVSAKEQYLLAIHIIKSMDLVKARIIDNHPKDNVSFIYDASPIVSTVDVPI